MRKLVMALASVVVVALGAAAIFLTFHKTPDAPKSPAAVSVAGADIGGPFTLVNQDGKTVTDKQVIDGPTLIYFGYTSCPDVCPIDVALMASAVDQLDKQGYKVKPVFITVDPARDTPQQMKYYVNAMHPRMVGLTGTPAEIKKVADEYKVYYTKGPPEKGTDNYTVNHTTFFYFMMPDGLKAMFRHGFPPKDISSEVARILARQ